MNSLPKMKISATNKDQTQLIVDNKYKFIQQYIKKDGTKLFKCVYYKK